MQTPSCDTAARRTLAGYGLTVFLSSALLLVLEIVADRARTGPPRSWSRMIEDILAFGTLPDALPVLTDDYAPVERLIADLLIGDGG